MKIAEWHLFICYCKKAIQDSNPAKRTAPDARRCLAHVQRFVAGRDGAAAGRRAAAGRPFTGDGAAAVRRFTGFSTRTAVRRTGGGRAASRTRIRLLVQLKMLYRGRDGGQRVSACKAGGNGFRLGCGLGN